MEERGICPRCGGESGAPGILCSECIEREAAELERAEVEAGAGAGPGAAGAGAAGAAPAGAPTVPPKKCATCGEPLEEGWRACPACGTPLR